MLMQKRKSLLYVVSASVLLVGVAGFVAPSASAQSSAASARPVRVRAKLDGFDLTPKPGAPTSAMGAPPQRPNQIGGASRSLGAVTLYAPTMGKAYALTPTFFWRTDDPQGEFTFKITQPASGSDAVYETKVMGGHFTYPADAPALQAGSTYVWTVQPVVDMLGGPVSASIVIIGGNEREAVAAALAKAQAASDAAAAQAKVYTDMRLWFDAVAAYSNLIESHPDRTDLYQARADLYDQLPSTTALADADVAKAHK